MGARRLGEEWETKDKVSDEARRLLKEWEAKYSIEWVMRPGGCRRVGGQI
jgi:hypothetical protein